MSLGAVSVAALLVSLTATVAPAPVSPPVQELCTPADPALDELSGLAGDGRRWFAVPDGGTRLRVSVLDPADCGLLDVITAETDPYDVEDLALAADGSLWLADTGDNDRKRPTVALHRIDPGGAATLYRLSYPDGPHDAEALLLGRDGVPYLVTKEVVGGAGVYRPSGDLAEPGPTPLTRVGTVRVGRTDTVGGPVGSLGSTLVTGGAVSPDGTVVALRTYTDAYLYAAPDGDIAAALTGEPVRIPLPGEPAGEAIALLPDGTLLSGSESSAGTGGAPDPRGGPVPLRGVPGAVALLAGQTRPETPARSPAPDDDPETGARPGAGADAEPGAPDGAEVPRWKELVVVGSVVGLLALLAARSRRRAR